VRFITIFSIFLTFFTLTANNSLADALVDDCEGKGQNLFGYYWFFFDDASDGGNSTLPGVTKNGKEYVVAMSEGGHTGNCLALPYKLGPKATTGKINYVGVGTMLCAEKESLDISAATGFSFWIKSKKETMVDFMVLTKDITDYAYYHKVVTAPAEWTKIDVAISELKQPGWQKKDTPFNKKCAIKFQWQMHTDNVGKDSTGTCWLDDISIVGYTFVSSDECPTCVGDPGKGTGALLSDLNTSPATRNARGYFWFCYNDAKNRATPVASASEFSQILSGATIDPENLEAAPELQIDDAAQKGYNSTPGAYLQFTLGPTFKNSSDSSSLVKPFIGMGTLLSNGGGTINVYDAKSDGATGIYFDYKLASTSPATQLKLEVYANAVASSKGVVHYIKLPNTGTPGQAVWKGATIPFSKLKLPNWAGVDQTEVLDATIMKKLQWAVQDAPATQGELAIDNVYFLGATKISGQIGVKYRRNDPTVQNGIFTSAAPSGLKVFLPEGTVSASISLADAKGAIVAKNISQESKTAILTTQKISSGIYLLIVKAATNKGVCNKTMPVIIY
jgi:hypothetical protein